MYFFQQFESATSPQTGQNRPSEVKKTWFEGENSCSLVAEPGILSTSWRRLGVVTISAALLEN